MKTKKFLLSGALGIALSGLILNGCHKDPAAVPSSNTTDITAAEDNANATVAANDAKTISDAAIQWQSSEYIPFHLLPRGIGNIFGPCVTITGKDSMVGGVEDTVVYIDFGRTNCFCHDNRNRRGMIIVYWGLKHPGETWFQAYFDSANTITLTFRDYFLRDNSIAGTRTWTNEGHNMGGFENWNSTANISITYPTGQTAFWNSSWNNSITEVDSVWYYEINGNASGKSRNGAEYTLTITSPVYFTVLPWWAGGCPWPEAGTVIITRLLTASSPSTTITL